MDEMLVVIFKILTHITNNGDIYEKFKAKSGIEKLKFLSMKVISRDGSFQNKELECCMDLFKLLNNDSFKNDLFIESFFEDDFKYLPRVDIAVKGGFYFNSFRLLQLCSFPFIDDVRKALLENNVPFPSFFKKSGLKLKRLSILPKKDDIKNISKKLNNRNFNILFLKFPKLHIPYNDLPGYYVYDRDADDYEEIRDAAMYGDDIEDYMIENSISNSMPEEKLCDNNKILLGIEILRENNSTLSTLLENSRNVLYITEKKYQFKP